MKDVMSRDRKSKKKVNERDQLSTSAHRDFDSAFSLSPAVTEVSNECCSSQLEDMSHNEPTIKQLNHTYVNIWSNESTQFEDVTQTEKTLPATISITNV
ncbi:unnamed protein product [Thelazia callipaeda]|uniref:MPHOSPH9 n=1 Tax=Thelazia callipaeda TaxID=103827 RepID=A0A0N5CZ16_THECL|nr:unnamed protein product [Thelazia callipaeda]